MAFEEHRSIIVAAAVALPLMLAGLYGLKRWSPKLPTRVLLGVAMLGSGAAIAYPLIYGQSDMDQSPARLGLCIALIGLGINQVFAPMRVAVGRAA